MMRLTFNEYDAYTEGGFRLCRYFGLSYCCFLPPQPVNNTGVAMVSLSKTLKKFKPWKEVAEQTDHVI